MIGIVHKYVRRVIRWLNTPSQEELDARAQLDAVRYAEQAANRALWRRERVLRALPYKPMPGEYSGLGTAELLAAATQIKEIAASGKFPQERINEHLQTIERFGGPRWESAA